MLKALDALSNAELSRYAIAIYSRYSQYLPDLRDGFPALKSLKLVAEQRYEEDCYKLEAEHLPDVYLSHTSKLRHTELVKKPLSGSGLPSHHRGCMQTIVTCFGVRPWRAL